MSDFRNENIWLMKGDCLERMKEIPDGSVDMVLTDPPYGVTDCEWDLIIDLQVMWKEIERVLKVGGRCVFTATNPYSSNLLTSSPLKFMWDYVWLKGKAGNFQQAKYQPLKVSENILIFKKTSNLEAASGFGAYIREKRLSLGLSLASIGDFCEEPWYFKGGFKYFETGVTIPTNTQYLKLKEILNLGDTYDNIFESWVYNPQGVVELDVPKVCSNKGKSGILGHCNSSNKREYYRQTHTNFPTSVLSYSMGSDLKLHPTQKPIALMEYLIKTYTNEGNVVLDFTMGSGPTLKAAHNLNRKSIGIEIGKCEKKGHKYEGVHWVDVLKDQMGFTSKSDNIV